MYVVDNEFYTFHELHLDCFQRGNIMASKEYLIVISISVICVAVVLKMKLYSGHADILTSYKVPTIDDMFCWMIETVRGHRDDSSAESSAGGKIVRMFTTDELTEYDGSNGHLYLSILGHIFDVQKGEKHYAKGKAYHHFTGRDASRAFVTGDFNKEGLRDDVHDLDYQQLLGLKNWADTYHKNYNYVGKLIGRYYAKDGTLTEYGQRVEEMMITAAKQKRLQEEEETKLPSCNTEWIRDVGGRVWCSTLSGGVQRDWTGFPRQMYTADTGRTRCVCVHPSKVGDHRFKLYPGCTRDSVSCDVK